MMESGSYEESVFQEEYTYRAAADQSLSEAVVEAVATFTGRQSTPANSDANQAILASLFDTIDPEALDSLFNSTEDETAMVGTVEFWYCGCEVTVQSDGLVIVTNR